MKHDVAAATAESERTLESSGLWLMIVLGTLLTFASISTDLYPPAMPAMSVALAATQGTLQYTVSGYLVGFSVGELFWRPIADRYGRRIPVAISLVPFMIGSAGCALSTDVVQLISCRVLRLLELVPASCLPAPWLAISLTVTARPEFCPP
jgi:DHA1 family bicyclomycin/chloramphenicol resistance-like MFS transporter